MQLAEPCHAALNILLEYSYRCRMQVNSTRRALGMQLEMNKDTYLQLADAGHGALQQNQKYARRNGGTRLAGRQPGIRQVRRHQRRGAGGVGR